MDKSKLNQKQIKSLSSLRFLVVDSVSGRQTMKKLLNHFKITPCQIDLVDEFEDAEKIIRLKRPNVVFADEALSQNQEGRSWLDILHLHLEGFSPHRVHSFFLSTIKDSPALISGLAEEKVDCILLKPLTFAILIDNFEETLSKQLNPSAYEQEIRVGRHFLNNHKYNEALEVFEKASKIELDPALALAYKGETLIKLTKLDEAKLAFEKGLSFHPNHFRCLVGQLDLQIKLGNNLEAYKVGKTLGANYNIPFKYIPYFISLSVKNKEFADVLAFYRNSEALIKMIPEARMPLAAGLVVSGLSFFKQQNPKAAMDSFRKAEICARGNTVILKRILLALITEGSPSELMKFMARMPRAIKELPEIQIAELEILEKNGSKAEDILKLGLDLINKGIYNLDVYSIVVKKSKEAKRNKRHIDELIQQAIFKFPEHSNEIEKWR